MAFRHHLADRVGLHVIFRHHVADLVAAGLRAVSGTIWQTV